MVAGGVLIVPAGLLASLSGESAEIVMEWARRRSVSERDAVAAVLAAEQSVGRAATETVPGSRGFDIESKDAHGNLHFITVKCRAAGAETFPVTRTEIGVGRNKPDQHILALVETVGAARPEVRYARHAFQDVTDPPFDAPTISLNWKHHFEKARIPS